MKLELKHLAPYLPYGLMIYDGKYTKTIVINHMTYGQYDIGLGRLFNPNYDYKMGLPILRPLIDILKEIEVNGKKFIPINNVKGLFGWSYLWENRHIIDKINIYAINYSTLKHLFEWHFDVFGLIKEGLAIDINTL